MEVAALIAAALLYENGPPVESSCNSTPNSYVRLEAFFSEESGEE